MTQFIHWFRRARRAADLPYHPHLRRDIGLPEIDRSSVAIGAELGKLRRWI